MRVCLGMLRTCSIYRPEVGINRESNWSRRRQKQNNRDQKYKVKWRLASCWRHRCTLGSILDFGSFSFMSGTKWHLICFLPDGKRTEKWEIIYAQKILWLITMQWQNLAMLPKNVEKLNRLHLCVISTCTAFVQTTHRVQIKRVNVIDWYSK